VQTETWIDSYANELPTENDSTSEKGNTRSAYMSRSMLTILVTREIAVIVVDFGEEVPP
jgi:hypothetical protein